MTTQFVQQVPYTFLLRLAPDNSYFILCPREVSIASNKCMSFYGYRSFADYNNVLPHYAPPTPVDFNQFGSAWCNESLTAYFNSVGLSSYKKEFYYEGVVYQANGNNLSSAGINNALLVGRLEVNNQIDTDFDNLFSNLISTLNTLLTPISQISLSLLGINNVFPTLVSNLSALNENNVPVSIAQILKDKQIDVDMSHTQVSLDDTNLVTQLQNIYTILSSQNANQAAISSAINNKDNQSRIVQELEDIFVYENVDNNKRYSSMKYSFIGNRYSSNITNQLNIISKFQMLCNCFLNSNLSVTNTSGITVSNRLLSLLASLNNVETNGNISNNLNAISARSKLNYISDIETKLEQNLPFATLTDVTLNVDTVKKCVTQDIKENLEI